jgi:hypothetical protein
LCNEYSLVTVIKLGFAMKFDVRVGTCRWAWKFWSVRASDTRLWRFVRLCKVT